MTNINFISHRFDSTGNWTRELPQCEEDALLKRISDANHINLFDLRQALWWGPLAKYTYVSSRLELIKERVEEMVSSEGELFRLADLPCLQESNMATKSQPAEPTDTCAEYRVAASLKVT